MFPLLAHNVLDALLQSGIVTVTEDRLVPTGTDSETGELDVVLDNVLIFLHLQVVNAIFRVSRGIDGARLIIDSVRRSGPRNRKKTENWTGPDRLGPDRRLRLRAFKMVKPI